MINGFDAALKRHSTRIESHPYRFRTVVEWRTREWRIERASLTR